MQEPYSHIESTLKTFKTMIDVLVTVLGPVV